MNKENKIRIASSGGFAVLEKIRIILTVLVTGLVFLHLFMSVFYYVISRKIILEAEKAVIFAALCLTALYLILFCIFSEDKRQKIRIFARRVLTYDQLFLIFLSIWYVVSWRVNKKISGLQFYDRKIYEIYDLFFSALVLFPMAKMFSRKNTKKIMDAVMLFLLSCYSVFTAYGLWQAVHLNFIQMPSGFRISIEDGMMLQFGSHYNITAACSFLMLVFCLYFFTHRNKPVRILAVLLFPMHLFVCHLTNSRTIFATGLIIFPLFIFFYIRHRYERKGLRFFLTAGIIAAGIGFSIYYFSRPLSFYIFEKLSHYSEIIRGASDGLTASVESMRTAKDLHGRKEIWAGCVDIMLSSPWAFLFGVTPAGISSALLQTGRIDYSTYQAHNIILHIGIAFGVPAMIGYCIFIFRVCIKSLRLLFAGEEGSGLCLFAPAIMIFSLIIPGLVEIHIAFYSIMANVFFMLTGWLFELDRQLSAEPDRAADTD